MMMIPRKNNFDLWEDFFDDAFFNTNKYYDSKVMRTDIKENDNNYNIVIDLPGYEKEDIKISIDDGYLTVSATMNAKHDEEEKGKFVKKERYFGECSRSFYVGDELESEEIKASFKNGLLTLEVPKVEAKKEVTEKKYISID